MSLMEFIHDALLYPRETKCDLHTLCVKKAGVSYNAIFSTAPDPVWLFCKGSQGFFMLTSSTTGAALARLT